MSDIGLVYTGKIISMDSIEGADFICCATVICGKGGKWKGVVKKSECQIGNLVTVYLPDALITEEHAKLYGMEFMKSSSYRVRMRTFKGAPSEVVIMPLQISIGDIGTDCTEVLNVTKYYKPVPSNLQGKVKGEFPSFIPKTDEPNYQNAEGQEYLDKLHDNAYYITEKADGSSTTAFKYKGQFGICSRNWELEVDENIGYWQIARRYQLEEKLPEGYAIQWETCGPKIQSNPMGLKQIEGYVFSGYNINEKRYLTMIELWSLVDKIEMPACKVLDVGISFDKYAVESLGAGTYPNGKQREGVVVRSQENELGHKPISFKVINLNYEK